MIVVDARLTHGSTYFAGEEIECQLCFSNPPSHDGVVRLSSDIETLAWSTAQIHCQCTLSAPTAAVLAASDGAASTEPGPTYFNPTRGERGITVMMSQPRILFCNIKLAPGEKAEYIYKEKIPIHSIPPTFRGTFVKYSYKLTIGTQKPDSPISEIKIPFRVLTVEGLKDLTAYVDKEQVLAPSNPFQLGEASNVKVKPEHTVRDLALQLLSEQSARRRNSCYNISNLHGKVSRIVLSKTSYKIGEDLYCTFDFTQATVQCLQVTITLQSVEQLAESHKNEGDRCTNVISHTNHLEFCLHMSKANVSLPIPLHITPTFKSEHVTLAWRLHIEFITLTVPIGEQVAPPSDRQGTLWHGLTNLDTETMHWDLPVTILSSNPLQCGILHSMRCDETINLD